MLSGTVVLLEQSNVMMGGGDGLKTQEPHLNEQLLFHLKIFHLSKKIKAIRQSTKYFDMQQIK